MSFSEKLDAAMQACETAGLYFEQQARIMSWPDLRPGQRVAALTILAYAFHREVQPTANDLAHDLGITIDRAQAIFDGLEHPPFALTKVGNDFERFVPTQTLEYGKA